MRPGISLSASIGEFWSWLQEKFSHSINSFDLPEYIFTEPSYVVYLLLHVVLLCGGKMGISLIGNK